MDDFEKYLKEALKNPVFAKSWEELEIPFRIIKNMLNRRYELGLTQHQLAERCGLKVELIEDIEFANYENLDIKTLEKIAKGLEMDIADLLSKS